MDWSTLTVPGIVTFIVSIIFGSAGSISSIAPEWHAQSIYHRCVMPSVNSVCLPPGVLGIVLGLVAYYVLAQLLLLPSFAGILIGSLISAYVSFKGARSRGTRIYADNVRRAGF